MAVLESRVVDLQIILNVYICDLTYNNWKIWHSFSPPPPPPDGSTVTLTKTFHDTVLCSLIFFPAIMSVRDMSTLKKLMLLLPVIRKQQMKIIWGLVMLAP